MLLFVHDEARRNFATLSKAAHRGSHRRYPKYRMRVGKKAQIAEMVTFFTCYFNWRAMPNFTKLPLLSRMADFSV